MRTVPYKDFIKYLTDRIRQIEADTDDKVRVVYLNRTEWKQARFGNAGSYRIYLQAPLRFQLDGHKEPVPIQVREVECVRETGVTGVQLSPDIKYYPETGEWK
jgi:hypothetical protein